MLPDFDRADAIGTFWGHPETRTFGGVADRPGGGQAARAVVFGLLAERAEGLTAPHNESGGLGLDYRVGWLRTPRARLAAS
jgi:hypothetical protein